MWRILLGVALTLAVGLVLGFIFVLITGPRM
jgi:hypothetical protein